MRHLHADKSYECFIERTRAKLKAWGGPYVIENVPKAPLVNPVTLCGSAFGLGVRRHRIFESNIPIVGTKCCHANQGRPIDVSGTGSRRVNPRSDGGGGDSNKPRNLDEARLAMGISWMTRKEISQAIPPAYGKHIGDQVAAWLANKMGSDLLAVTS
jgi:DNA (cytosine-5)-methyltransferase 1